MMMQKAENLASYLATTIFLIGLLVACSNDEGVHAKALTFKIGVVLPLSGNMAEYGQNAKEGLTLAAEELNRLRPLELKVRLAFQDDQGNPPGMVSAVRRLIDAQGVKFIIGGLTSSAVLAAAPYAQAKSVLFFSPAASAPSIPEIGNFVFRNWQSDALLGSLYGEWVISKLGLHNIVVVHVSNDYGVANKNAFASAFTEGGGKITYTRAFPEGETDFRSLVTKLRSTEQIEGYLLIAYPDEYKGIYDEITVQGGLSGVVLTSDTFFAPSLLADLVKAAEGTYCAVAAKPERGYEPRQRFIQAYGARFKDSEGKPKVPGLVSDTAYDALHLVARAISETDGSPERVAQRLSRVKDYRGAAGQTTFTLNGDILGGLAIYRVQDGEFIKVLK